MYFHFWTLLNYPHYCNSSASICLVWAITICSPDSCSSIVFSIWSPFIFSCNQSSGDRPKCRIVPNTAKREPCSLDDWKTMQNDSGFNTFAADLWVNHWQYLIWVYMFGEVLIVWLFGSFFVATYAIIFLQGLVHNKADRSCGDSQWQCCKMKYYFLLRPSIMLFYVSSIITIIMCSRSIVVVRNFFCYMFFTWHFSWICFFFFKPIFSTIVNHH